MTYHQDIRPLIERSCVGCHQEGGVGPFPLTEWSHVEPRAFRLVDVVLKRIMPPAQADPTCRKMQNNTWMTERELDLFEQWAEADYPKGDPADYPGSTSTSQVYDAADLGPPDVVVRMPEPYEPEWSAKGDDYVQMNLEGTLPGQEKWYIHATRFVPGAPEIVHHADVMPRGPDGDFIGTQGNGIPDPVGAYAPGAPALRLPEGTAFVLPAGTQFFVDMHYHRAGLAEGESSPRDQSELHLWAMPKEEVTHRAGVRVIQNFDLDIPAGEDDVVQRKVAPVAERSMTIFGALPHMHYLGESLKVEIVQQGGSNRCILHEPFYDFDWQIIHRIQKKHVLQLSEGARARLTCTYDNTRENQPYINGQQLLPSDVSFGPSSLDEMCLSGLFVKWPYSVQ